MPFEVSGIKELQEMFAQRGRDVEPLCKKAVKAGGNRVRDALKDTAPVDTGALRDSIKTGPVKYGTADGYYCEVTPSGNHPETGEPLAKIGNILEFGRSNMAPKPWFHPTVKKTEGEAIAAMREIINKG